MCRAKRIALKCMALIFLAASLCQAASAIELSPRASLFLDNYGADIYEGSSTGSVRIDFTVVATRHSDLVGVSQINSFEIVYAMTKGGPGTTTSLLAYRLYMEATKNMNYGMASAITMVMFLVTAVYGIIGLRIYRKVDY